MSSVILDIDINKGQKVKINSIKFKGLNEFGNVYVYSIIGNPLYGFKNKYLKNFSTPINLKPNNLYIVRIELKDGIKTFKILSN